MCFRSESLCVYSCISDSVSSREGREVIFSCREGWELASIRLHQNLSALRKRFEQEMCDVDRELQREQRAKHDRQIEQGPTARRQTARVEDCAGRNHDAFSDEISDRARIKLQSDHWPARPGWFTARDPVEEHVRQNHCGDQRATGAVASDQRVCSEPGCSE